MKYLQSTQDFEFEGVKVKAGEDIHTYGPQKKFEPAQVIALMQEGLIVMDGPAFKLDKPDKPDESE